MMTYDAAETPGSRVEMEEEAGALSPEMMLVTMLVKQAILDKDTDWFESDDRRPWTFIWICEVCSWDVGYMRRRARAGIAMQRQKKRRGHGE